MELRQTIKNLITALNEQHFSFENNITNNSLIDDYGNPTGVRKVVSGILQSINDELISYENIDKEAFSRDLLRFKEKVDDRMLIGWGYSFANLSLVGIMHGDHLYDNEILNIFTRFEEGVYNIMRYHVGKTNDCDAATFGTLIMLFQDSSRAEHFNEQISKQCYSSHFFKSVYCSTISIDCTRETMKLGKSGRFSYSWCGGLDISSLKKGLFE